ncbi:DUF5666 domain-containing protein [Teichococcus coralli]|uniref:DUF5666 domain-containing protein n=1 Tax=Teichococcus coralli TaxID=2545983 RepID=UPI00136EE6D7|nr:DUF5666 domain-containing protein [Pseudoroseomonas coralli]
MRPAPFLLLALLAGCAPALSGLMPPAAEAPALCQAGPDGGPPGPLADRAPFFSGEDGEDRGIGGTGISGTVSGFASICVNGLEVQYDTAGSGLHVGDRVVIEASGSGERLTAHSVAVRHEVSGPVEAAGPGGVLQVAGQRVLAGQAAGAAFFPGLGEWVAVSGFRRPDEAILATRISRRAPGTVLVRGTATVGQDGWKVAGLRLHAPPGFSRWTGPVTLRGTYASGTLEVEQARLDLLRANPALRFGAAQRLVLEGYVSIQDGQLALGALRAPLAATLRLPDVSGEWAVVDLRRQPDGGFIAVDLRQQGDGHAGAAPPQGVPGGRFGAPRSSHPQGAQARHGHAPPVETGGGLAGHRGDAGGADGPHDRGARSAGGGGGGNEGFGGFGAAGGFGEGPGGGLGGAGGGPGGPR